VAGVSYLLCYRERMAVRDKRSVSMPPELAAAVDEAARTAGTTFSAWLADAADHRLRMQAGQASLAEWESEQGPLSPQERAAGLTRARQLLGRAPVTAEERA
jgi:hypothetical protein